MRVLTILAVVLGLAGCGGGGGGDKAPTHTPEQVAQAFKAAGLEVGAVTPMAPSDYGLAPVVGKGARFLVPSLGEDSGGRIVVGSRDDLTKLKAYYDELGKSSGAFYSWTYRHDDVLVQINGEMKPAKAAAYGKALDAIK